MSTGPASPHRRKSHKGKRNRSAATPERLVQEVAEVREIVLSLERLDKSSQLYPQGSAVLRQHLDETYERLAKFLARAHALELTIAGDEIEYEGEVIYDATRSQDRTNLAYTFEDGGIRRLVFLSGIDRGELQGFCDAMRQSREPEADDLATLLWANGLRHVSYMTVNFYAEPIEQPIEDLLAQSTKMSIVDRLRNRELEIDQIAMVRSDHPADAVDNDLPEIFALTPQESAEIQRRIAEYQGESGLGAYCRVIMSLLMQDQNEDSCRAHLTTLQETLDNLVAEGEIAMAAEVVAGVRRLAEGTAGYGAARAQAVALRGFIAVGAKKELGAKMGEHLARGRIDLKPILAYIRALGKHSIYVAVELLGGRHDSKIVAAIAEGCAGDYVHIRDFVVDQNPRLAAAAVKILSDVAGDGGRVDYIRASMHKDTGVRREAFVALAKCKDSRALDRLLAAFDDEDPEIRLSALRAFNSCLYKPRTELYARVHALIADKGFADRPQAEQEALFSILGKLDPEKGVPFLKDKLTRFALFNRSSAHKLRLVAASALAEVATESAEEVLKLAADTKNEELHRACRAALDRLDLVRATTKQHLDREKLGFEPDRSGMMRAFDRSGVTVTPLRSPGKDAAALKAARNRKASG
jgi:HEAT repeat protein